MIEWNRISEALNQFQASNPVIYALILIVITAFVASVFNYVVSRLQPKSSVEVISERILSMIERLSRDFYGKTDVESRGKIADELLKCIEEQLREKFVTKDEFEKTKGYMTDPETGKITVLRAKDGMITAVTFDPDEEIK